MKLLGSTTFNGKKYEIEDVRGFHNPEDFGLPEGFYGGRVDKVAGTNEPYIFLMVEKHKVIDIMQVEEPEIDPYATTDEPGELKESEEKEVEADAEVPFEEEGLDYYSYTNDELRTMLLELGIEAPKKTTKDELVALFNRED